MSGLIRVHRRVWAFFTKKALDAELAAEIDAHLQLAIDEYIEHGVAPAEARRLALVHFGGVQQAREKQREARGPMQLEILAQDLRYAVRKLMRAPGFTAVAVLILALSIGGNTAIFSFVNSVLLKPLPYPHPGRIVSVWEKHPGGFRNWISTLNFLDWKRENRCFQLLSAVTEDQMTLTGLGSPQELFVQKVSPSYFKVLDVRAALGHTFAPGEDQLGKDQEVLLSNRIWQSQFGGDPNIIGRKITLDAKSYIIIGVLPADSEFDRTRDVMWLPLAFRPADMTRNYHWLSAIARLKPGVTLKQARAQMDAIGARIATAYPESNNGWGVIVEPLIDEVVGTQLRRSLWVLLAAVGAVLLIGCANLASLMLARGTQREHEIAVRSALGARRLRLIRQLLTESTMLGLLGSVAGFALGAMLMRWIKLWMPPGMLPPQADVHIDSGILLLTLIAGVLTGFISGLAPAMNGTRSMLAETLKDGGSHTAGQTRHRTRTALVIAEVALTFMLLAGAGLLLRSFDRLATVNPGVDTTNVLAMDLPIPPAESTDSTTLTNYLREITANVRSLPGVRAAAMTNARPIGGWVRFMPCLIQGWSYLPYSQRPGCFFKKVGPAYFYTVGMRLLMGRGLAESDTAGAPPVAVINETMAKTYFKGQDPIGKHISIRQLAPGKAALGQEIPWQVVGVVSNEKIAGSLGEDDPVLYVTFYQSPLARISLAVRAAIDPSRLTPSIKEAIWKVNKNQAVTDVATLEQIKSAAVAPARIRTILLTIFAAIAVLLAAIGIFGVLSYSVAQRVHEMAIRKALGASSSGLMKLVIGRAMLMVLLGLAAGAVAALALARVLASLLYDTSPTDPVTWVAAGVLLSGVALLASYIPARRAAKADPMAALRHM